MNIILIIFQMVLYLLISCVIFLLHDNIDVGLAFLIDGELRKVGSFYIFYIAHIACNTSSGVFIAVFNINRLTGFAIYFVHISLLTLSGFVILCFLPSSSNGHLVEVVSFYSMFVRN